MLGTLEALFLLAMVGYVLGSIKIKGVHLGTSGVLLAALYFGHLGLSDPVCRSRFGSCAFCWSSGTYCRARFFRNLKQNAMSYGALAPVIIGSSAITVALLSKTFSLPGLWRQGIYTGH